MTTDWPLHRLTLSQMSSCMIKHVDCFQLPHSQGSFNLPRLPHHPHGKSCHAARVRNSQGPSAQNSAVILAGDFNVHNQDWLQSSRTTRAGEYAEDMCHMYGLEQLVHEPTRGRNTLDLVMSDLPGRIVTPLHPPLGKSDHAVIVAHFDVAPAPDRPTKRTVWRYQQADWPRLRAFLRDSDWSFLATDDVDTSCDKLTRKVTEAMKRFIPSKVLKQRASNPIWWSPECQACVDRKQQAWRRHRSPQMMLHFFQPSRRQQLPQSPLCIE